MWRMRFGREIEVRILDQGRYGQIILFFGMCLCLSIKIHRDRLIDPDRGHRCIGNPSMYRGIIYKLGECILHETSVAFAGQCAQRFINCVWFGIYKCN